MLSRMPASARQASERMGYCIFRKVTVLLTWVVMASAASASISRRASKLSQEPVAEPKSRLEPAVKDIKDARELVKLFEEAGGRPVSLNFWTETCGFCHMMMPHYEKYAEEFRDRAYFRKINIREHPKLAKSFKIHGLPNFKFVLKKKVIEEFRGASKDGFLHHFKKALHRADSEEIKITRADLVDFFREHEPEVASSDESIDMLLDQGGKDLPRMLELLQSQYGSMPNYEGGFIQGAKLSQAKAVENQQAGLAGNQCQRMTAADMTTEDLEAELARRRAAEMPQPSSLQHCERVGGQPADGALAERVVIIGGGPAGLSAAVYAARSGLCPLVIAPSLGGQLMMKGVDVENYPGLPRARGLEMVLDMRRQAESFHAELRDDTVVAVDLSARPFKVTGNESGVIRTETIIIATGSNSRWLGVPGEDQLRGHGVTGCAACDGYLHRGERCAVVGGGDSALEDALMLSRICKNVTIIHRREAFRASRVLQDRVRERAIAVLWNTEVVAFVEDKASSRLGHIYLKEVQTGTLSSLYVDAAFIAIGHIPNTDSFKGQLEMLSEAPGYLSTEGKSTRTSVPGVFAAGDAADPTYRQAVTSAGSGAQAAIDAERWLSERPAQERQQEAAITSGGISSDMSLTEEDLNGQSLQQLRGHSQLGLGQLHQGLAGLMAS